VDAVSGGAECGRARLDAVYEKEMVQPLSIVQVESCEDACGVESCFLDEFVMRVCAVGEEGSESVDGGCLRCSNAARDNGENIDIGIRPMLTNGICEGVYLSRII
jgi:hypothetical protein